MDGAGDNQGGPLHLLNRILIVLDESGHQTLVEAVSGGNNHV